MVKDIEKSMYSLDEAQKGIGGKPANQKEIQRVGLVFQLAVSGGQCFYSLEIILLNF